MGEAEEDTAGAEVGKAGGADSWLKPATDPITYTQSEITEASHMKGERNRMVM